MKEDLKVNFADDDLKKALEELEALRGTVSNPCLNSIRRVKENLDLGLDLGIGNPALLVNVNPSRKEGYLITVIDSFQGASTVTQFFKTDGRDEVVETVHLTPKMIRWMAAADQRYQDGD
ncbi:hypothetical protein ACVWZB_004732 [Paenibacillus polymyxa]